MTVAKPKSTLSVVIPNYNHGRFLKRALKAVMEQSLPPDEVIVIDDGSTDNSLEILQEQKGIYPSLQVHPNGKNQGVTFSLNRGLGLAKSEYVFVTSADDEILAGLFQASMQLLAEYPQAAFSCAVSYWQYEDDGTGWYMGAGMAKKACYLSPEAMVKLGKQRKLFISTSSAIMRKEPLLQAGGFISELKWHCDWFAVFATGFRHGICYIPDVLSQMHLQRESFFHSGSKGSQHRNVLLKLAELLNSREFADVRPFVRDSGALGSFGNPMLRILLSQPQSRSLVSLAYIKNVFWRNAELLGKKMLPDRLARWILKRFYSHPKHDHS